MIDCDPFNFGAKPHNDNDFTSWAPKMLRKLYPSFSDKLIVKKDIVYQAHPFFSTSIGAKLLVIGGGPSTNDLTLTDLQKYDSIWSLNKFYKHPLLKQVRMSLVVSGAGINLLDDEFQEYLYKYEPVCLFEIHPKWQSYHRFINNNFYIKKNIACFHSKIYGAIGCCIRMINLAAAIGIKEIHFIGLDGSVEIKKGNHAFTPGKTELPSLCNIENADIVHLFLYNHFWTYIQDLYPQIKLISLQLKNPLHAMLN